MDIFCLNCRRESKDTEVIEEINEKGNTHFRCPLCNDDRVVTRFLGLKINDDDVYKVDIDR